MSYKAYEKHQRSKYMRYVYTHTDGTVIQSDNKAEIRKEISKRWPKVKSSSSVASPKPQFDPNTGERTN